MRREVPEEHRKCLAVPLPRFTPERGHPEERDVGVERDREGKCARARRIRVGELEARRTRAGRARRDSAPAVPDTRRAASPPVPRAPAARRTRPRSHARARVPATRCRARPRAPGRRARRRCRPRSARGSGTGRCRRRARPPRRVRRARPRAPGRRSAAARARPATARRERPSRCSCRGEERPPPEPPSRRNETTRTIGRAPVEQPRRDREVLNPPDPVRDEVDQGRTSSTASSASGWCSSSSNRPGSFAVNGMRTGLPGVTGFSTS